MLDRRPSSVFRMYMDAAGTIDREAERRYGTGDARTHGIVRAVHETPRFGELRAGVMHPSQHGDFERTLRKSLGLEWDLITLAYRAGQFTPTAPGSRFTPMAVYTTARSGARALLLAKEGRAVDRHPSLRREMAQFATTRGLVPAPWDLYLARPYWSGDFDRIPRRGTDASGFRRTEHHALYVAMAVAMSQEMLDRARRARRTPGRPRRAGDQDRDRRRRLLMVTPFDLAWCLRSRHEYDDLEPFLDRAVGARAVATFQTTAVRLLTDGLTVVHAVIAACIGTDWYARVVESVGDSGIHPAADDATEAASHHLRTRLAAVTEAGRE